MKRNIILWAVLGLFFSVIVGCNKINSMVGGRKVEIKIPALTAQPKGPIVAKVNNISIGLDDFNQEVDLYNANVPADKPELKVTTREQKIAYLKNEVIRRTLLYQDALDKGLDRNEDVLRALEKTKMDLLVLQLIKDVTQKVDVSSKEIEDYYNTYKEQLKEPEERQIREIVVPTEQDAKDIMIQLLQGADFATLAKERSISSSAKNGGDLGFIKKGQKPAQFDAVAFSDSLELGKISSIFKGPDGYYIIKLELKHGGKQKSLSDMWDDIKRGLTFLKQQQVVEDLIGKLSREAKIEINEGEIK
ncbi:MAG: peptidylprolyl isomerase [Candidatus Omnitrophota bacterium]